MRWHLAHTRKADSLVFRRCCPGGVKKWLDRKNEPPTTLRGGSVGSGGKVSPHPFYTQQGVKGGAIQLLCLLGFHPARRNGGPKVTFCDGHHRRCLQSMKTSHCCSQNDQDGSFGDPVYGRLDHERFTQNHRHRRGSA